MEIGSGYRQGDVVITPMGRQDLQGMMNELKSYEIKPKQGRVVLAEGEVTGHAHTLPAKGTRLFSPPGSWGFASNQTLVVVTETAFNRGDLVEGKVLATMPGGTIRFQMTDGVIVRFHPDDITLEKQGVRVKRAFTPMTHDEHDAIPVGKGAYRVIQHQTATVRQARINVAD